jgi:hypothetical protein
MFGILSPTAKAGHQMIGGIDERGPWMVFNGLGVPDLVARGRKDDNLFHAKPGSFLYDYRQFLENIAFVEVYWDEDRCCNADIFVFPHMQSAWSQVPGGPRSVINPTWSRMTVKTKAQVQWGQSGSAETHADDDWFALPISEVIEPDATVELWHFEGSELLTAGMQDRRNWRDQATAVMRKALKALWYAAGGGFPRKVEEVGTDFVFHTKSEYPIGTIAYAGMVPWPDVANYFIFRAER